MVFIDKNGAAMSSLCLYKRRNIEKVAMQVKRIDFWQALLRAKNLPCIGLQAQIIHYVFIESRNHHGDWPRQKWCGCEGNPLSVCPGCQHPRPGRAGDSRAIQHDPSGLLACQPMESQVDPGRSQGSSQCPGDGNQCELQPIPAASAWLLFASLEPHAPEGLLEAVAKRTLKADPVVMISNCLNQLKIARKHQVPFRHVDWSQRQQAGKRL